MCDEEAHAKENNLYELKLDVFSLVSEIFLILTKMSEMLSLWKLTNGYHCLSCTKQFLNWLTVF